MYVCEECGYCTDVKCNYVRHVNRKSKCGWNNIESERKWTVVDDKKVKCIKCNVPIIRNRFSRHELVCKGVPVKCCRYCVQSFKTPQAKYQHQKICKQNPANIPPQSTTPSYTSSSTINIINNHYINNHHFSMILNFGQENVGYLLSNIEHDHRIAKVSKSLTDTMDLINFNEDHPENQTVRKLNKKSDLMEIRRGDEWEAVTCATGIPRLRHSLASTMKARWFEDNSQITDPNLKEMLYYKSMRGPVPEHSILERYSKPNVQMQTEQRCADECAALLQEYLKMTSKGIQKVPCMVQDLTRQINEVREKYSMPGLSISDVCRSY